MLANLTILPRTRHGLPCAGAMLLLLTLLGATGCGQGAYEKKLQASVTRLETEFLDPTKADPNAAQPAAAGAPAAAQPAAGAAKPAPQGTGLSPAGQAIVAPLDLQ